MVASTVSQFSFAHFISGMWANSGLYGAKSHRIYRFHQVQIPLLRYLLSSGQLHDRIHAHLLETINGLNAQLKLIAKPVAISSHFVFCCSSEFS